jgi:hypothetical protein
MSGVAPAIPRFQFESAVGVPLVAGTVDVYLAGTTTRSDTWLAPEMTVGNKNTNPIVLDARGEAVIYLNPALAYKFVLKNSLGVEQWTQDDIEGSETSLREDLAASGGSALVGFLQAGSGAVVRTLQDKERDFISVLDYVTRANVDGVTSNQTEMAAAVAYAYANGLDLYWPHPGAKYVSNASIPNFHSVRHFGPGQILRGTDTFYISPTSAQTNRVYVGTAGSDTNDGLTAALPVLTVQKAFDILKNYGPVLNGTWRVVLAAGTYGGLATFPENLRGKERVVIEGPVVSHPNVPTAILDGTSSQTYGLVFLAGNKVTVSNVKFQNFTSGGISAQDFCDIFTTNVHCANAGTAIIASQSRLYVAGGIIQTSTVGIEAIAGTTFTVGYGAANLSQGTQILNCTQSGMLAQEHSSGHADYVTIDACVIGLNIVVNSRVHAAGCDIKNNVTAGVRTSMGSSWFNNGSTLTANALEDINYAFSAEIGRAGSYVSQLRTVIDTTEVTHTGTVAETVLKTYATGFQKDSFVWNGRSHKVIITGSFTGAAGTKTLRVKANGSLIHGLTSVVSSTGAFRYEGCLQAVSSTEQRSSAFLLDTSTTSQVGAVGNKTVDFSTGAEMPITITGELSVAGESIIISNVEMWETA